MKKTLLTLALAAATALGASAQMDFDKCFTVKYDGKVVAPGETIYCNHYEDSSDIWGDDMVTYECLVDIENKDIMPTTLKGTLLYSNPSYSDAMMNWEYGIAQLCYESKSNTGGLQSGCLMGDNLTSVGTGELTVPAEGAGTFQWQIHLSGALNKFEETYILALQALDEDGTALSTVAKFPILFSVTDYAGVDEIGVDAAEGEWYDLQGRRVAQPSKGLYIYKTAGKAVKKIVK